MDSKNYYDIELTKNKGNYWFVKSGVSVTGYAFHNDRLLKEEALGQILQRAISEHRLKETLKALNGFFSAVIESDESVYLISDKVRSYPLIFCKSINGKWIITDSTTAVKRNEQIEKTIDKLSSFEFLSLGYVSGHKTIYEDVSTVDAGEYVEITPDSIIRRESYFKYIYEKNNTDKNTIIERAFTSLEAAFQRTLASISPGSQIVIPLSGGYDSRLVACLCKKYNVENVICFTYGRKESFEVKISEQVARILGFKWYYVEYTGHELAAEIETDEFKNFSDFASNCNAIPHVQEILAIRELLDKHIISGDAVVIPGFCGDIFGGSKVPREVFEWKDSQFTQRSFAETVYHHFYDLNIPDEEARKHIIEKIEAEIEHYDISNASSFIDYYEQWCISNRLAKYIINALRTYEFFGLEWRMPLWDDQYAANWYQVPWKMKTADLLNEFMFTKYFCEFGVDIRKPSTLNSGKILKIKRFLPKSIYNCGRLIYRSYIRLIRCFKKKQTDINCFNEAAEILSSRNRNYHNIDFIRHYKNGYILAVLSLIEYYRFHNN